MFLEIWMSIKRTKLRTCLTGFAVTWGIFMLIVLLGVGQGLLNAFNQSTGNFSTNTMIIGGGYTSMPYKGLQINRFVPVESKDINLTGSEYFSHYIDNVTATVGTSVTVCNGNKHISAYIEGNYPSRVAIENIKILAGRFINEKDISENRKIVVIPDNLAERLLDDKINPLSIIGQHIEINGFLFLVVGVSKEDQMGNGTIIYSPFSTVKTVFNKGELLDDITFTFHGLETEKDNEEFERTYRAVRNISHKAAPEDTRATWIGNRFTQYLQIKKGNAIVIIALWIIGILTLLSGIVGISNIMLISVKERIHELGIRKSLGASPWHITKLIIMESLTITSCFGYIGILLGFIVCEIIDKTIGARVIDVMGEKISMLVNPTIGLDIALEAMLVLIIAGVAAGISPSWRAAHVRPIEALREE